MEKNMHGISVQYVLFLLSHLLRIEIFWMQFSFQQAANNILLVFHEQNWEFELLRHTFASVETEIRKLPVGFYLFIISFIFPKFLLKRTYIKSKVRERFGF